MIAPRVARRTATIGLSATIVAAAALAAAAPAEVAAQDLPFAVPIVDWERQTHERQRRAYRAEGDEHEVLFCVEVWTRSAAERGVERIIISRIRRERAGAANRIADVGRHCLGPDGAALPMIHTHSNGNCQHSPSDLVAAIARDAPFEGVQCGERHFVWTYAWQLRAIAEAAERTRLNASRPPE